MSRGAFRRAHNEEERDRDFYRSFYLSSYHRILRSSFPPYPVSFPLSIFILLSDHAASFTTCRFCHGCELLCDTTVEPRLSDLRSSAPRALRLCYSDRRNSTFLYENVFGMSRLIERSCFCNICMNSGAFHRFADRMWLISKQSWRGESHLLILQLLRFRSKSQGRDGYNLTNHLEYSNSHDSLSLQYIYIYIIFFLSLYLTFTDCLSRLRTRLAGSFAMKPGAGGISG